MDVSLHWVRASLLGFFFCPPAILMSQEPIVEQVLPPVVVETMPSEIIAPPQGEILYGSETPGVIVDSTIVEQSIPVEVHSTAPAASEAPTAALHAATTRSENATVASVPEVDRKALAKVLEAGRMPMDRQQRDSMFDELSDSLLALQRQSALMRRVVQVVRPSVVHIIADKRQKGADGQQDLDEYFEEAASGVLVEIDGRVVVLTNRHVVKDADVDGIHVELTDGRVVRPTQVWSDSQTDVAVVAIEKTETIPARIGNSDELHIGDMVLAFGSPFGLSHSVTQGIISAKGRRDLSLGAEDVRIQDFLQTDAAINPGNSGGPLINMRGEIIGLNTAIASNSGGNEGIGFSIPINMALQVGRQLLARGSVARIYLGVKLDADFQSEEATQIGLPRRTGSLVTRVVNNSPASRAKIQAGDVILSFDGVRVEDDNHLVRIVGLSSIGKQVPVDIYRDGRIKRLMVDIEERLASQPTGKVAR